MNRLKVSGTGPLLRWKRTNLGGSVPDHDQSQQQIHGETGGKPKLHTRAPVVTRKINVAFRPVVASRDSNTPSSAPGLRRLSQAIISGYDSTLNGLKVNAEQLWFTGVCLKRSPGNL